MLVRSKNISTTSSTPIYTSSVINSSNQYLGQVVFYPGRLYGITDATKYPEWVEIQYSTPGIITKLSIKPQDGNI